MTSRLEGNRIKDFYKVNAELKGWQREQKSEIKKWENRCVGEISLCNP